MKKILKEKNPSIYKDWIYIIIIHYKNHFILLAEKISLYLLLIGKQKLFIPEEKWKENLFIFQKQRKIYNIKKFRQNKDSSIFKRKNGYNDVFDNISLTPAKVKESLINK